MKSSTEIIIPFDAVRVNERMYLDVCRITEDKFQFLWSSDCGLQTNTNGHRIMKRSFGAHVLWYLGALEFVSLVRKFSRSRYDWMANCTCLIYTGRIKQRVTGQPIRITVWKFALSLAPCPPDHVPHPKTYISELNQFWIQFLADYVNSQYKRTDTSKSRKNDREMGTFKWKNVKKRTLFSVCLCSARGTESFFLVSTSPRSEHGYSKIATRNIASLFR